MKEKIYIYITKNNRRIFCLEGICCVLGCVLVTETEEKKAGHQRYGGGKSVSQSW